MVGGRLSYYRGRTPLVVLFRELAIELETAEKIAYRFGWVRNNCESLRVAVQQVDPELERKFVLVLEGHPAVPFGLAGLGLEGMCLCRAVDCFQSTLVEFVSAVFKQQPETLLETQLP